jgi:hypothetical protein
MTMGNRILFCWVFKVLLISSACAIKRQQPEAGVVVRRMLALSQEGQLVNMQPYKDRLLWYKDSTAIIEIHTLHQFDYGRDSSRIEIRTEKYKFVDLKTKEMYEYQNFSDTAKMIKKCAPDDQDCIGECWKFWDTNDFMSNGENKRLSDTTISGIKYARVQNTQPIETEKGNTIQYEVGYFRYDKKNGLFMFNVPMSRKVGYPMVTLEVFCDPPIYPYHKAELEYLPRPLTPQELKVFAAWERNAKNYKTP